MVNDVVLFETLSQNLSSQEFKRIQVNCSGKMGNMGGWGGKWGQGRRVEKAGQFTPIKPYFFFSNNICIYQDLWITSSVHRNKTFGSQPYSKCMGAFSIKNLHYNWHDNGSVKSLVTTRREMVCDYNRGAAHNS